MGASRETSGKHGKGGKHPAFDLDDPELPAWIEDNALASGGFPYDEPLKRKPYKKELAALQLELLKLEKHMEHTGGRLVVLFEGRDASGKGSCISRFLERLNPRHAHSVALSKPTETERGQWYFQRYVEHLPSTGNMILFDRSWYNRAGVERVMGFCTDAQAALFLAEAPHFEAGLVRDGIILIKLWLTVGREMQLKRFHSRRHHPLKRWKLTDIDIGGLTKWEAYNIAQEDIFRATHTDAAPWTVVRANDKLRARLNAMRAVLSGIDYAGKDASIAAAPDPLIVGSGPALFATE
jgi:polyphosphate kinase 2